MEFPIIVAEGALDFRVSYHLSLGLQLLRYFLCSMPYSFGTLLSLVLRVRVLIFMSNEMFQ
jgi:hypothetical protein